LTAALRRNIFSLVVIGELKFPQPLTAALRRNIFSLVRSDIDLADEIFNRGQY
jgi:hypothetical protein